MLRSNEGLTIPNRDTGLRRQRSLPSSALMLVALPVFVFPASAQTSPRLQLSSCSVPDVPAQVQCGRLDVLEDRARPNGRHITLRVVVLPARNLPAAADPVFYLAGGPGQSAVSLARAFWGSWMRDRRAVVLMDQRGTGQSNPLHCAMPGSPSNLQGYLESAFQRALYERCRVTLEASADLTQYTSLAAIEDLDEIRRALAFDRINLVGASGGTRTSLLYLRRYPNAVRTLVLSGVAPPTFRNPLPHARSAQDAIDRLFQACAREAGCNAAFPQVDQEFRTVLDRLQSAPARVTITDRLTREPVQLTLTRSALAEMVRVLLYNSASARQIPLLIHQALAGNYAPIVGPGVESIRAQRTSLAMGMFMSVTCNEDVARITPQEIEAETRGTFLGDVRVRGQMDACAAWPRASVPAAYGQPVTAAAPALLFSGEYDPVTPPRWGEETVRTLRNGVHFVLPRGHNLNTPCTDGISRQFLDAGSMAGIDTSCIAALRLPPFELPTAR
ncbi:MAG: alpha/beta fold hydrolase [Longimicrobiales bacterium]